MYFIEFYIKLKEDDYFTKIMQKIGHHARLNGAPCAAKLLLENHITTFEINYEIGHHM